MSGRAVAIMGYGQQADRQRVRALAKREGISTSEWIVKQIRATYTATFGNLPPDQSDHQE